MGRCCTSVPIFLWVLTIVIMVVSYITQLAILARTHNVRYAATDWAWVGCIQSTEATFRVRAPAGATRRLLVIDNENNDKKIIWPELIFSDGGDADSDAADLVRVVHVENLIPNRSYFYMSLGSDFDLDDIGEGSIGERTKKAMKWEGSFKTPPASEGQRFSFKIAAGGCSMTGSQHRVFEDILEHEPLFMLHMGDFHYEDLKTTSLATRTNAFDLVMGSTSQRKLFNNVPIAYMWDDHDYVGNDSDGSDIPARDTARQSYQMLVPHCPLPATALSTTTTATSPVAPYHAFTIGTVRFVICDLRSESQKGGSIYSPEQQAWLYAELDMWQQYDFVVWVTSRPWIGSSSDTWAGWPQDRENLSNYLSDIGITNLLVVSSDNHQIAFDDGTHTDFSTGSSTSNSTGGAHFPIIHAGPLTNLGTKPFEKFFSEGCISYFGEINHQYVTIEFDFDGEEEGETTPCVELKGYRSTESPNDVVFEKRLCNPLVRSSESIAAASAAAEATTSTTCNSQVFSSKGKGVYWTFVCVSLVVFTLVFWSKSKSTTPKRWREAGCLLLWYVGSCLLTCIAAGLAVLTWGLQIADFITIGSILLVQSFSWCVYMVWWHYRSISGMDSKEIVVPEEMNNNADSGVEESKR